MHPAPQGWPRFSSSVFYEDAPRAIDWLCDAFGLQVSVRVDGPEGHVEHCQLTYGGEGLVMIGHTRRDAEGWRGRMRSPRSVDGANTQCLMLFVDDVDAHCAHARSRGANIVEEPATHDYGPEYWCDRSYGAVDPEGHLWWFTQRLRSPAGG